MTLLNSSQGAREIRHYLLKLAEGLSGKQLDPEGTYSPAQSSRQENIRPWEA